MVDFVEYWMRYFGADVTAFQVTDTVVGVTAVDFSPDGAAVAADAEGTGNDARTSSTSSRAAARRAGRVKGMVTSFTCFHLLGERQDPECRGTAF
jgi:hypothetical protein